LKYRYRDQRVYVAADLILYYEKGNPRKSVVPDVFVVKDCDTGMRETYLLWEEGQPPDVAIEITSKSSKYTDEVEKPRIYSRLGVAEYFVFDPYAEYLRPPLAGFRKSADAYERIEANARGQLECRELGIAFELDGGDLVLRDAATGEVLLTRSEAAEAALSAAVAKRKAAEAKRKAAEAKRKAAEKERRAEQEARKAAEERAATLERELRRLRGQQEQDGQN
jgi:hypothetical protein